jgi:hypothetical protein
VLELLHWEPAVCSVMRLVCSTWGSILDALLPRTLNPRHSLAVMTMEGKLGWFESVTMVILVDCGESASAVLAELRSMPSLCGLWLPASCAERAVDAEAVYGLTTLTTLCFRAEVGEDGMYVEETGEWVLDLSRLTTLNCLQLAGCSAVTDEVMLAVSSLPALTSLIIYGCFKVTDQALRAVSSLPSLTFIDLTLAPM